MIRQEGYYWIRQYDSTELEVAQWDDGMWWLTGADQSYRDDEILYINETQLLPPTI